jgi:hypothetical protein
MEQGTRYKEMQGTRCKVQERRKATNINHYFCDLPACCLLPVACCLLPAACCLLFVAFKNGKVFL